MTQQLSIQETADLLSRVDDILILTHKNPDGDAIGSALSLCTGLRSLGKRCNAVWSGTLSSCFELITSSYEEMDFTPRFILAVDIAVTQLLPSATKEYAESTSLCIDHHNTNSGFAAATCLDADAASCCEIIIRILEAMGVTITPYIGSCIYVGLSTDTGCFKFSNTTPESHLLAARLFSLGVDIPKINQRFFEEKPRSTIEIERKALAGMEYACDGKICLITITREMMDKAGCIESDIEGIAGIPKGIVGVEAGVTLREQTPGMYKISVRTKTLNASKICASFGGGGHIYASGCECSGDLYDIKVALVERISQELKKI